MDENISTKFFKVYANLPLPSREEIVAVVDGEPMSWNVLRLEVQNGTKKAAQALAILIKLHILE